MVVWNVILGILKVIGNLLIFILNAVIGLAKVLLWFASLVFTIFFAFVRGFTV